MPHASRIQRFRGWLVDTAKHYPARLALGIFALLIGTVTALLCLPIATTSEHPTPFVDALFTATSAVAVTGLATLDTASHWSLFGQAIIAIGIFIGGIGVMTLASLLAFAVSKHLGLTQRMLAAAETKETMGGLIPLLKGVIGTAVFSQLFLFLIFFPRFYTLGESLAAAVWHGLFMSVSVFNNAGFVVVNGGLGQHIHDWWMLSPVIIGTVLGAIGFPVMFDLYQHWRTPRKWSLHTKLTLSTYFLVITFGTILIGILEWNNPNTFGSLDTSSKLLNLLLSGVNAHTSGLSALDIGVMNQQTHFVQDILMMIGGGSASTAGGIKVTTFAVLVLAAVAEARGDSDIEAFGRRIAPSMVRLAISVAIIGVLMVSVSVVLLLSLTDYSLDVILFESISAFATVGLSTGITPTLPTGAKYVLIVLMYFGRTGTMTLAAALALRERRRVIRMPEERLLVG